MHAVIHLSLSNNLKISLVPAVLEALHSASWTHPVKHRQHHVQLFFLLFLGHVSWRMAQLGEEPAEVHQAQGVVLWTALLLPRPPHDPLHHVHLGWWVTHTSVSVRKCQDTNSQHVPALSRSGEPERTLNSPKTAQCLSASSSAELCLINLPEQPYATSTSYWLPVYKGYNGASKKCLPFI